MRTTIDSAGRIVIPKSIRSSLGLSGGESVEVRERDGVVEIELAPTPMRLENRGGVLVAVPETTLPTLTDRLVRETLERSRR